MKNNRNYLFKSNGILFVYVMFFATMFIYPDFGIGYGIPYFFLGIVMLLLAIYSRTNVIVSTSSLFYFIFVITFLIDTLLFARKTSYFTYYMSRSISILISFVFLLLCKISYDGYKKTKKMMVLFGIIMSIYIILVKIKPSVFFDYVFPYLSSEAQIQNLLINQGYGVQIGASSFYASYYLAFVILCEFSNLLTSNNDIRINIFNIFIMSIALLLEGRRAHSACLFITLFLIYYFCKRKSSIFKKSNTRRFVAILFFVIVITFGFLFANGTLEREIDTYNGLVDVINGKDYNITTNRIELWDFAISLFKENPIFGIGLGKYGDLARYKFLGRGGIVYDQAHNDYLQVLCENGLIGFMLIYIPMFFIFYKTIDAFNKILSSGDKRNLELIIVSFGIQAFCFLLSFLDPNIYKLQFSIVYAISIVFLDSCIRMLNVNNTLMNKKIYEKN